jgi:polysaccharide biosynthesis/export protein
MTNTSRPSHLLALAAAAFFGIAPAPAAALRGASDPVAPAASVPSTPSQPEYVVGSGDKLRIEVYKDVQLSQSLQVRPDGKITLPLVGDIVATGLTPLALRDAITSRLREYVSNPVVTVIVVEASAATAYVVGEVNKPGAITVQGGQLTVLQALALAGALKDFPNSKNIRILRKSSGGVQTIGFNYKDAIRGDEASIYLRPGDTVVVPD